MPSKDAMKEVDRFFPATVTVRKEWAIYHQAVALNGNVVIQEVWPAVGESEEQVYDKIPLTYAQADALVVQIMSAMATIKKSEEKDG